MIWYHLPMALVGGFAIAFMTECMWRMPMEKTRVQGFPLYIQRFLRGNPGDPMGSFSLFALWMIIAFFGILVVTVDLFKGEWYSAIVGIVGFFSWFLYRKASYSIESIEEQE